MLSGNGRMLPEMVPFFLHKNNRVSRLYESIAACSPFLSMEFFLSVMSLQLFSAGGIHQ